MADNLHILPIWESYRDQVIPPDAPPQQIIECKRAFYAGVKGLFDFIGSNINNDNRGPGPDGIKKVREIHIELEEFRNHVLLGME